MRVLFAVGFAWFSFASPVLAQNSFACDKDQVAVVREALSNAKDLTVKAAARVGLARTLMPMRKLCALRARRLACQSEEEA